MATRAVKSVHVSNNSSSSDDEDLQKCKEAVWELHIPKPTGGDGDVKDSKRVVVADHDHDGNDLQVTKGFRTHVAKKLGLYLDSCISDTHPEMSFNLECDDDDEGFRLFSTSVLGQKAEDPPAPVRRRPASSSSDSDSEMEKRLKEAAVSIKDLLPSLLQPIADSSCSTETPSSEKVKKRKKKKENSYDKKKKHDYDKCQDTNLPCSAQNSERSNENGTLEQVEVKRKKKKKQRIAEENASD